MLVTGAQPVGAKGVTSVQATVVDLKEATRLGFDLDQDGGRHGARRLKAGEPQPVVFPRSDVGVDHRPVALRQQHAAARYRSDGGAPDGDAA